MNVTLRLQAGANPIEAAKAVGHASVAMTAHYTLRDPAREAAHVASISGWITNTPLPSPHMSEATG